MKTICKSIIYIAAAISIIGCAKHVNEGANVAGKRYLDAWLSLNYPTLEPTWKGKSDAKGIYVFPESVVEGTGAEVKEDGYAIVEFTATDIKGNITSYTSAEIAKQLGVYEPSTYYGSQVWLTFDETIQAGLQDALVGMKVGGSKKVLIPSWLMSYSSYDSTEDFFKKTSEYDNAIYEFTVKDFTDSIEVWQADSIERYIVKKYSQPALEEFKDTSGFFLKSFVTMPEDAKTFEGDTTIHINYTGRLLNGQVFDTTNEKIAKDYNIYDPSRTYTPVLITMSEEFSDITMGTDATSVITGFAYALSKLKYDPSNNQCKDKVVSIFTSAWGYSYSGSGASIPGYSPLIFEIEVTDAPEE